MEINNEELDKFNIIQIEKNKNHKKKLFPMNLMNLVTLCLN